MTKATRGWLTPATDRVLNWPTMAKAAAAMHLFGLGLIVTMGWHDPLLPGAGATIGGLPALHLAFLMATGATAALLTLGSRERPVSVIGGQSSQAAAERPVSVIGGQSSQAAAGADQLLAQMSHELRTPLNAMIGFSEVMLRELYGPLGDTRYQKYAAHISESSGRLLKTSEDALAVTETMSAVMAERIAGRRERAVAGGLVRDAWTASCASATTVKLAMSNCAACDIMCERRATGQALQHLLREAVARAPEGGTVEVRGRRRGGARSIEIRIVDGSGQAAACSQMGTTGTGAGYPPAGTSLRMMLARLLLEMQGATLSAWDNDAGIWSVCVAFPPST